MILRRFRERLSGKRLREGSRVALSGGYDMEPKWLSGRAAVTGTLERFIPGQNRTPAAVVRLDQPLVIEGNSAAILVLELRHEGSMWTAPETVHVEWCDFEPDDKSWANRRQGKWVESHASINFATSAA